MRSGSSVEVTFCVLSLFVSAILALIVCVVDLVLVLLWEVFLGEFLHIVGCYR